MQTEHATGRAPSAHSASSGRGRPGRPIDRPGKDARMAEREQYRRQRSAQGMRVGPGQRLTDPDRRSVTRSATSFIRESLQ